MSGFKLLGVKPLAGCNERFLKNLTADKLYWFYNNFECTFNRNNIEKIEYKEVYPLNLYNVKNSNGKDIQISISALVGKNGSGKSALSELFLLALFVISNNNNQIIKDTLFFYDKENTSKEKIAEIKIEEENFEKDIDLIYSKKGLNIEFYYLLDNEIFQIIISEGKAKYRKVKREKNNFYFNHTNDFADFTKETPFFYSMVVNYSLYSFNTNDIGMWIKSFFHKNDGYQMPVVINPYRIKGNIDINNETYLTRSRLLANILSIEGFIDIYKKSSIKSITLELDEKKDERNLINKKNQKYPYINSYFNDYSIEDFRDRILKPLFKRKFGENSNYPKIDTEKLKIAEFYLIRKIDYVSHLFKFRRKTNVKGLSESLDSDKLINYLIEDQSHVTLKIRQTINFINIDLFGIDENASKISIDFKKIREQLVELSSENNLLELQEYVPPPIFKSKINFFYKSDFDGLSSGEKQLIYSLNSIIYHIKNLDSVHKTAKNQNEIGKKGDLLTYNSINLILDEIELYYHPEFQRETINQLLLILEKAKFNNIANINILFLTHSPFILSDIPSFNTLKLTTKKEELEPYYQDKVLKTFGANIHDLLADSFFLKDGFMGEFAKEVIQDLINYLTFKEEEKISESNILPNKKWDEKRAFKVIGIIDEPLIKERLISLHNKKFLYNEKELLSLKIQELQNQLNILNNEED